MRTDTNSFTPEGVRVMPFGDGLDAVAHHPFIVGEEDGKTRVFAVMFSYGGWCWRALPYDGPKHRLVAYFLETAKERQL